MNVIDETEMSHSVNCNVEQLPLHIKPQKNSITIVSQNIRSIYSNLDDLQVTMSRFKIEVEVIILTECRVQGHRPIPQMANFKSFVTSNHLNQNDGVVVYLNLNVTAKVTEIILDHASCLKIDLGDKIILGIYRSPSNTKADSFIHSLSSYLSSISNKKDVIITGDININILPQQSESSNDRNNRLLYLNTLSTHGLLPGHYLPTRHGNCLDHFIIKIDKNKRTAKIAILTTTITDHSMILLQLTDVKNINNVSKSRMILDYESASLTLKNKNLSELLLMTNPNTITSILIERIKESILENTRAVQIPSSQRVIKPWITSGILKCIKNRDNMQKTLRSDPFNETLKITYKRYRNFCNALIKKLKYKYNRDKLMTSSKNSKTMWKTVNEVTNFKPPVSSNSNLLSIKRTPKESINSINGYFANIGKQLAENITTVDVSQIKTPNYHQPTSFTLLDTDVNEINSIINSLDSNCATGWDNIPTKLLKLNREYLAPIICHLTNTCFHSATFPKDLKKSIITPVYKSGDRANISNYRPISVLTSLSKIVEKLLNNRLLKYLEHFNILSENQFGFRKGLSTEDAIAKLTSIIIDSVDHAKKCLVIFLDLKKAFDTVSTTTLLKRLESIGIRGIPLNLFASYLSERKQCVKVDDMISDECDVTFGVPQGSVLGPTLFLIYINNLTKLLIQNGKIISYADDTAIIFTEDTWDIVHKIAEEGLYEINKWLRHNMLTLNYTKTNYMCFTKTVKTQPSNLHKIKIHDCDMSDTNCTCLPIRKVNNIRYLGVIVDQRLSWNSHIELIMSRTRKLIYIFRELRHVAKKDLLIRIYKALAESILCYCITIWGGAIKTKLIDLERAQRALLKVMFLKNKRFATQELYSLSDLLSIRKLYILHAVLKKHTSINYDPSPLNRRRKYCVATCDPVKSIFAMRQYPSQSTYLYNIINKRIDIYSLNKHLCKNKLKKLLNTLTYDETEMLLKHS